MIGYQGGFSYNCQTRPKILHCQRKSRKLYATPVNWNCHCKRFFYNCHPVNCKFLCNRPLHSFNLKKMCNFFHSLYSDLYGHDKKDFFGSHEICVYHIVHFILYLTFLNQCSQTRIYKNRHTLLSRNICIETVPINLHTYYK